MKKGLPEIRESASELKNLVRAEKKARRRERLQMLYLIKTGQARTRKSIAQMLSVHRTTIGCWLNAYERGGLDCMLHMGTKPNHKSSIPVHIFHSLKRKLRRRIGRCGGFKSYKSIKLWLEKRYSLCIPYSTVHNIVRYGLRAKKISCKEE